MARKNDGIMYSSSDPKEPFSTEEHEVCGRRLKRIKAELEKISAEIKYSYDGVAKVTKDLETARQSVERVQSVMSRKLLFERMTVPEKELLPIYLGR
jgi:septal ring factor EnvC (AmiA/AmiB activator)